MTTTTGIRTGAIEHIDPNEVVIEANVRPSAPITKEFVATIREHGVMQPVLGRRDNNGNVLVRAGQRRTLGAREAGVATIPVYIVDGDEETANRIIEQLIENEQRIALSDADRAAAWQQLSFEGLSVSAIAKRTGAKTATVKTGLAVAENSGATSALIEHQLNLEQAAVLIEFEGDEDATAELIEIAQTDPNQFEHAAQRARNDRQIAESIAAAQATYLEAGYEILTGRPAYDDRDCSNMRHLRAADGDSLDAEKLATLEGRAVLITQWRTDDEPSVDLYLRGWKAAGYTDDYASNSGSNSGPMTDEQKAERKELIANNKAWAAAETVRREWLIEFLTRKALPKDITQFIARGLTTHRGDVYREMQNGNPLAHTLLSIDAGNDWRADKLSEIVTATPTKAQLISLAIVLAGIEANTSKNTWRYPEADKAAYLAQIAAWGYTLSPVEQIVIDGRTAKKTAARAA